MKKKTTASARVQITVEVYEAAWGEDCQIGQLYDQAAKGGVAKLRKALVDSELRHTIIGEPKVIAVMAEQS